MWAFEYRAELPADNTFDSLDDLKVNAWVESYEPGTGLVPRCLQADIYSLPDYTLISGTPYNVKNDIDGNFCAYYVMYEWYGTNGAVNLKIIVDLAEKLSAALPLAAALFMVTF